MTTPAWEYPTLAELRAAADQLRAVAPPTPLVECAPLSRLTGVPVWLKCEQFQPIGAFKVRGAWTAVGRLSPEARSRGIVTHSSGNHGQAVAFTARQLGLRAVIVMPETAPLVKVNAVRSHGAEVVFVPPVATARSAKADELAQTGGLTLVPPYDDPNVILGQATCGLEILDANPEIGTILTPIGGGGLLAGTACAVSALRPTVRLAGVEPTGAPKLSAALAAGAPTPIAEARSIADGLLPLSVGRLTWRYIAPVVHEAVAVTDEEIATAMKLLFWECGLRVEPSGAVSVAALQSGKFRPASPIALVLTGGNVDPARFHELVG